MSLTAPVVFLIFNRPETTARVFAEIRRARPSTLLIVADGPRPDRPGEAERCHETRKVVERIDWDCNVIRNYTETNMGCKHRPSSGLTWAFEQVDRAIVLEDDCLPHPSFFRYCEELLERYQDDERIMSISGDNFQFGHNATDYSYYYSRYNHVWGWASWRRAWQHYDVDMKLWPLLRDTPFLSAIFNTPEVIQYWSNVFERVYEGGIDTWDYQWMFACWLNSGLTILSSVNLISNIGFGEFATHSIGTPRHANLPVSEIQLPLKHPPYVVPHIEADLFTSQTVFGIRSTAVAGNAKIA
jgi:hypothetical protein